MEFNSGFKGLTSMRQNSISG